MIDYYYPEPDQLACQSVPLIVFSHGGISSKTGNVSLFSELASHGCAVASLDHPYQAFTTINGRRVWMDGRYFRGIDGRKLPPGRENSFKCFQRWMDIRIQDINAAIHYLTDRAAQEKNFAIINPEALGAAGHSWAAALPWAQPACVTSRRCWSWNPLPGRYYRYFGRGFYMEPGPVWDGHSEHLQ